jgi:hypothetical protein
MIPASRQQRFIGVASLLLLVVLPLLSLLLSCGKNSNPTAPSDIVFPDSNISYARYVQPLFYQKCTLAGCHDDESMAGGLSLTSYTALTAQPGIVIPKNSTNSLLAQVIDGGAPHAIAISLTANQIKGIKKWIDEGALDN